MVWRSERTTPAQVEAALRAMLIERHGEYAGCIPARTLNLVCVVDARRARRSERLRGLGRRYASRTIVCSVEPGRTAIGALATIASDMHPRPGEFAVLRETVVLAARRAAPAAPRVDRRSTGRLRPADRRLVAATTRTRVRALLPLSQVVLLDSIEAGLRARRCAARTWLEHARVVDLAGCARRPGASAWRASIPPPLRADLAGSAP